MKNILLRFCRGEIENFGLSLRLRDERGDHPNTCHGDKNITVTPARRFVQTLYLWMYVCMCVQTCVQVSQCPKVCVTLIKISLSMIDDWDVNFKKVKSYEV